MFWLIAWLKFTYPLKCPKHARGRSLCLFLRVILNWGHLDNFFLSFFNRGFLHATVAIKNLGLVIRTWFFKTKNYLFAIPRFCPFLICFFYLILSVLHSMAVWIKVKANGTRRQKINHMSIILVSNVGGSSSTLLVKMVVITSMMVRFTVRLASK